MARNSVATDDFNRASLGTTNWAQLNTGAAGDITIYSSTLLGNQYGLQPTEQRGVARWIGAGTFTDDQYSELTLVYTGNHGVTYSLGVVVRASADTGANRDYYEALVVNDADSGSGHSTTLAKYVNGTRTVLNTGSQVWTNGDKLSIEAEGTTIRLCKNGTALGGAWTVTDSSITTGLPGVTCSGAVATNLTAGDDWVGGSITGAGGSAIGAISNSYRQRRAA